MSTDRPPEHDPVLARMYRSLADDLRHVPLDPPGAVRAHADRHARARTTLAVSTAVALAAGLATVAGGLLRDHGTTVTPAPATQVPTQVTPAPPATTTPPPPATTAPTRTKPPAQRPASIPAAAFLTQAELNSVQKVESTDQRLFVDLCGKDVGADDPRLDRWVSADVGRLVAAFVQRVSLYDSPGAARSFMADLRDAVRACPSMPRPGDGGGTVRYELLDAPDLADDVVLLERRLPAYDYLTGEVKPGETVTFYTAAVRHGDAVTVLDTGDFEASSLDLDRFLPLLRRAAERLTAWRGAV